MISIIGDRAYMKDKNGKSFLLKKDSLTKAVVDGNYIVVYRRVNITQDVIDISAFSEIEKKFIINFLNSEEQS